jgi:D-3-phosphoglycerate dehydrogenase / 2-oxoglutarate reductase
MVNIDNRKTILTTTSSFGSHSLEGIEELSRHGLQVVLNPFGRKLKAQELLELLEKHRPVGLLAGLEPIAQPTLTQARDYLKVISRVGVGWDNIDLAAAAEQGILIYRTSGVLTQAVAELTIGLMLAALRSIALQDRNVRQGLWKKRMGGLLHNKMVGLIGFGAIGRRVGELAKAFGCEVVYYDPQPVPEDWARKVSFAELLAEADIISLHASGKERLLGAEELNSLGKRGVLLVNTARGELIDDEALCACLKKGRIGYAALDVFAEEPYTGPLCALENVILTPHIGSYALESRLLMEETAISNLLRGLRQAGVL